MKLYQSLYPNLYPTYNASWIKFLGCLISSWIVTPEIMPLYHAHNLYAQYQHNQKYKFTFKEGNKQIIAEPNYIDSYTIYNLSALVSHCAITFARYSFSNINIEAKDLLSKSAFDKMVNNNIQGATAILIGSTTSFIAFCAKLYHLTTDGYDAYNYTVFPLEESTSHTYDVIHN